MLSATLYQLLLKDDSDIAKDIQQNIYVDNIITGFSNVDATTQFYHKAKQIMSDTKFNLRTWVSNHNKITSLAHQDNVADSRTTVNVLGLLCRDTVSDTLTLNPKGPTSIQHSLTTKRDVLKDVSKLLIPLGLFHPLLCQPRWFYKSCGNTNLTGMNLYLRNDLKTQWSNIITDLQSSYKFIINGHYSNPNAVSRRLHIFVDASKKGYGAVVYLCQGRQSSFIMSKTCVAPLKELTLPKLELMAAVVGTRLLKCILRSLLPIYTDIPFYMWSDSQIVLYWINSSKRLPQFVSHRITEIQQSTPAIKWKYCPTKDNPADLLTRGLTAEQLHATINLWMHGPAWLHDQQQ